MTPEAKLYLEECWGYSEISEIDDETIECIRENADDGFELDQEIWNEYLDTLDSESFCSQ